MRILLLAIALSFAAAPSVFAHGKDKGHGACKTYWEGCKDKKGKDKFQCMKDAATAANDKACLDEMAKHKDHMKKEHGEKKGDDATAEHNE